MIPTCSDKFVGFVWKDWLTDESTGVSPLSVFHHFSQRHLQGLLGLRLQAALAMEAAEVPCKAREACIIFSYEAWKNVGLKK